MKPLEDTESQYTPILVTHHVPMVMRPTSAAGTRQVMQTLGRRYVRTINHTYRRSTLWGRIAITQAW